MVRVRQPQADNSRLLRPSLPQFRRILSEQQALLVLGYFAPAGQSDLARIVHVQEWGEPFDGAK